MNKLLKAVTVGFLYGTAAVMLLTFIVAYLSPDKAVVVYIDRYNEANLELAVFIPLFLISTYGVFKMVKEERQGVLQ